MRQLYFIQFIFLIYLVKFSHQHTRALSASSAGVAEEASVAVAAGATRESAAVTRTGATAATNAANRRASGIDISQTRDSTNQRILATGIHKSLDDLATGTLASVEPVQSTSDANEAAVRAAVAKITAIIHNTGDAVTLDAATMNTQIVENVKLITGKLLVDLGATLTSVQTLINEEVSGLDLIVSSAVTNVLKNIQDATSIIATSTHAALQATKNNVITAGRAVSVDISALGREVSKEMLAARSNIQRTLLSSEGTLQIGASLLGKVRG